MKEHVGFVVAFVVLTRLAAGGESMPVGDPTEGGGAVPKTARAGPGTAGGAVPKKAPAGGAAAAGGAVPKKAPAEGAAAGGAASKTAAARTVKLNSFRDRLVLSDGKVLVGAIVAAGTKAVVIVTAEGELTVPREKIERMERGHLAAESVQARAFETEVADGHEHVIVPPGLGEEAPEAPPGIDPRITKSVPSDKTIGLRYKVARGDAAAAAVEATRKEVEELPGKDRATHEENLKLTIVEKVAEVAGDGAWTVNAGFEVRGLVRDGVDVTALEAKGAQGVQLTRTLSAAGLWQPAGDKLGGAAGPDARFARWLSYVTVPVPATPMLAGASAKLEEIISPAVAAVMLPPPGRVTVPNWTVSGRYTVQGTADAGGVPCALVVIDMEGTGSGDGAYGGTPARVDVKTTSQWTLHFAYAAGRPVRCLVKTLSVITGQMGGNGFKCGTDEAVDVQVVYGASGAVAPPAAPADKKPVEGPAADKPKAEAGLDKALDELMKAIQAPDFFETTKKK